MKLKKLKFTVKMVKNPQKLNTPRFSLQQKKLLTSVLKSSLSSMIKDCLHKAPSSCQFLLRNIFSLFKQVKHFDKRRDFLKYKKKLETEGYRPPEAAGKSQEVCFQNKSSESNYSRKKPKESNRSCLSARTGNVAVSLKCRQLFLLPGLMCLLKKKGRGQLFDEFKSKK